MKNKFSIAISLAVILAMVITSLALADNYFVDNDVFDSGNQNNVSLSAAPGALVNTSAQIVVNYNGNKHLDAGSAVTFTVSTSQTDLPSGYSVGNVSSTVPSDWGTTVQFIAGTSNISFTAP